MFDKTGEEKIYIQNNELSGRNEHTCECTMEFVQPLFLNKQTKRLKELFLEDFKFQIER